MMRGRSIRTAARFDWEAVRARTDLRTLVESYGGPPGRGGRFVCLHPGADGHNLALYDGDARWKCHACGAGGDCFAFVQFAEGCDAAEAYRRLAGGWDGGAGDRRPAPQRKLTRRPEAAERWLDPEWQAEIERLVCEAEELLWSRAGAEALGWLVRRGLGIEAIRVARLGFLPRFTSGRPLACLADGDGPPEPIRLPRGVVIPWPSPTPGRWAGLNVRRLAADVDGPLPPEADGGKPKKYRAAKGSKRGFLYPKPSLDEGEEGLPIMLVEGEFDAIVGRQELAGLVTIRTAGGASTNPDALPIETRSVVAGAESLLVATDFDAHGTEAAINLMSLSPRASRRAVLPHGKDLSEFAAGGADLRAWAARLLGREDSVTPQPAKPFDLNAWMERSRLLHAVPQTDLSSIADGLDLSDPEDAAEAEARRLEKAGLL